jgi:hypothetical protein
MSGGWNGHRCRCPSARSTISGPASTSISATIWPSAPFAHKLWAISQQIGGQEPVGGTKTPGRSGHWATTWQARGAERRSPGAKRRGPSHPATHSRRAVRAGRDPASDAPAATNPAYPGRAAPSPGQRQPGPKPRPSPRHGAGSWTGCLYPEANDEHQRWESAARYARVVSELNGWLPSAACFCSADSQSRSPWTQTLSPTLRRGSLLPCFLICP